MKKTAALLGLLCMILVLSFSSCKKEAVNPDPAPVDFSNKATVTDAVTTDDTYTLQKQLNTGNVTLTAGRVYNVSSLTIYHVLNMNGATINVTNGYGYPIRMTGYGASISNGTIKGNWSPTQPADPDSGAAGLYISADNCSVSHMTITSFSAYGILAGPVNHLSVTNNVIKNTGYIAFYFDAETKLTSGGIFTHNTIDRSALPASTVSQLAVAIRGSTSNASIITSNWNIGANTIKMPYHPSHISAECMEIRYVTNSAVTANTFINGSIGCSVVRCSGITMSWNKLSGSSEEAIEFADSKSCSTQKDIITSSAGVGILIDGSPGCNGILVNGDAISGTPKECIHAYTNTANLTITGCTLTAASGARAINLQRSSHVKIQNSKLIGNGIAALAVMIDSSPGNIAISGGSISGFKSCGISIYNGVYGLVTNNITMSGVTVTGVPRLYGTAVANGGLLGSNISITL